MESVPLLRGNSPAPSPTQVLWRRRVLLLVAIIIAAVELGQAVAYAPNIALYESIICEKLHAVHCKSPQVQGELAFLTGVKDTIDQIPGLVLALPFGLAADRIGRRTVILIALYGLIIEEIATRVICWCSDVLPLRAIWITPLAQLLGGGPNIASSMAYAIVTDVFPAQKRSSIYFLLAAMSLVGEIVGCSMSSLLMWKNSPWLSSTLGLGIQAVGLVVGYALPETRSPPQAASHPNNREQQASTRDTDSEIASTRKLKKWLPKLPDLFSLSPGVLCVLAAFMFASIGIQSLQFIVQYASVHFGWSIGKASLLIAVKGVVVLITLLLLLPSLTRRTNSRMSSYRSDLLIVQVSAWLLACGAVFMGLATSPGIFVVGLSQLASGWGFFSALRSLATSLTESSQVGALSTTIAMMQSGGFMLSGPLLASAFTFGLSHSKIWRGLPYMIAAGFFLAASFLAHCISRERPTTTAEEEGASDTHSD